MMQKPVDAKEPIAKATLRSLVERPLDGANHHSCADPDSMERKTPIASRAMDIVLEYERQAGRNPIDVHKDGKGFDILSSNDSGETFIEVKGVTESWRTHNWQALFANEVKCLNAYPGKFFLYIVHFNDSAYNLYVIPGKELLQQFSIVPETYRVSPISQRKLNPYKVTSRE
jgi:Protein NO VEIN, C-terminal